MKKCLILFGGHQGKTGGIHLELPPYAVVKLPDGIFRAFPMSSLAMQAKDAEPVPGQA